jgi:methionyl-tRNA synthetase
MKDILLTTAISYSNGRPHIGHLYESILADFIKNTFIILDYNIKLLTGTDEHGKKIQETAKSESLTEIQLCDKYSEIFKLMNNKLQTKYDHFIRTTDEKHKEFVVKSVTQSLENDDIYSSNYEGWYDVKEECYISDLNAKLTNYINPMTNKLYEKVSEETFMFKLTKYKDIILEILSSENKLIPNKFNNELLKRVESTDFLDLSITRTTFDWGIKFPMNENHVIYVWFDALLNYDVGNKILFDINLQTTKYHLIGKDIVWFHSVIYPAILKSINITFDDRTILIHGHILDSNGIKMSKSLGNVIDVDWLLDNYPLEAVRFYLINETILGSDILFSINNLKNAYNNILLKNFGNLFQRLYKLLKPIQEDLNNYIYDNIDKVTEFKVKYYNCINEFTNNFNFQEYKKTMNYLLDYSNKELTDKMPWKTQNIESFFDIILHFNCACSMVYAIIPNKVLSLCKLIGWSIDNLKLNNNNININYINEIKLVAFTKLVE